MRQKEQDTKSVRLDQWLHAARFFKTRALSAQAVKTGRVLLNDARTKPAHALKIDDVLSIRRETLHMEVVVVELSTRRAAASIASTWYSETERSQVAREAMAEQRRLGAASSTGPDRRPDKKSRRKIIQFNRDNG
ncbi:MAG: RNA-binding S4 domain-containing protein [Gammaproteobacteria bacterium]